jgi:hypothetical protein
MGLSTAQKKQVKMIVILLTVFIGVLVNSLIKVSKKKKGKVPKKEKVETVSKTVSSVKKLNKKVNFLEKMTIKEKNKQHYIELQEKSKEKEWGEDPFYPNFEKNKEKKEIIEKPGEQDNTGKEPAIPEKPPKEKIDDILTLSGISKIGKLYFATINRKMMQEGKSISGYKVDKIQSGIVMLTKNGKVYELRLQK